ncbi:MAG TPA: FecR family protein [bacterium]|nr:FecR family protein [bacterium]
MTGLSSKVWKMLLGLAFLGLSQAGFGQTADPGADEAQYSLEDIQGSQVQVLEKGADQWAAGEEGEILQSGDEVKVGEGSQATLMLGSDTSVQLAAGTDMTVHEIEPSPRGGFVSRLMLSAGNLLADVRKNLEESQSTFEVEAGGVVCGVRGTAFEVSAQGGEVETLTHEGTVDVKGADADHLVDAGKAFSFRQGRFWRQRLLRREEMSRFQRWRAFRAQVFEKRRHRLENIRRGLRKAWVRRALRRHRRQEFLNRR